MISGHGTIETAVSATKLGAFDFLEKPLSIDRTLIVGQERGRSATSCAAKTATSRSSCSRRIVIIGDSVPMKALRQQIALMAPTNGRVLIYGETRHGQGTGRARHPRPEPAQGRAFVEVNCAAIPED